MPRSWNYAHVGGAKGVRPDKGTKKVRAPDKRRGTLTGSSDQSYKKNITTN